MKKFSFVRIIEWSTSLLITMNVSAQSAEGSAWFADKTSTAALASVFVSKENDKMALERIKSWNPDIYHHLKMGSKNASGIFFREANGRMVIYYNLDDIRHQIFYTRAGRWHSTVRTYGLAKLNASLRKKVEAAYPGYVAFGTIAEVTVGIRTAYLITVENCSTWKRIRIADNEMDVYEEYTKG